MSAVVTLKRTVHGKTVYENVPADRANAEVERLLGDPSQQMSVEMVQPTLIFRDENLTPVSVGDFIRYRNERHAVEGLFQTEDGTQYAEISSLTEPGVNGTTTYELRLADCQVCDKEPPGDKADRFVKVIKEIARSYGQELNAQVDIKAKSTTGSYPALIIKAGPSPLPSISFAVAVAYDKKDAGAHVLMAVDGNQVDGFPIFVRLGTFTAKRLLTETLHPAPGFDEALDRMDAWSRELTDRGYRAPKAMPMLDDGHEYDEEAEDATPPAPLSLADRLRAKGKKAKKAVMDVLAPTPYMALSPREALRYAKEHKQGARFVGTVARLSGRFDFIVQHEEIPSTKGTHMLQRYRVACSHNGRPIDIGGVCDAEGRYKYAEAYRRIKPENLVSLVAM